MSAPERSADAIVIGSGFGGAVSAARLAEAGCRVIVLERGPWWGNAISGEPRRTRPYPRGPWGIRKLLRGVRWASGPRGRSVMLNRDGLLELHVFEKMNALTGSGVGGGSLIYGDVQSRPDDAFFDYFPDEISAHEMGTYYDRVRAVLQPSAFPQTPQRSAILERCAAANGRSASHAELAVSWAKPRPEHRDLHSTTFLVGCEYGGKRSLDKTYVALALRSGASVRALCEAIAIERHGTHYRVHWIDHTTKKRHAMDAPVVVVSAGTLGTLRLLFAARDRDRSLQLPSALGRHFSTGGDMAASLLGCPDAEDSEYGPSPCVGVRFERDGDHSLFILESGLPIDALPLPERIRRRLRHSVGLAAMGRDASAGVVSFDGRELHTSTSRSDDPDFFDTLEAEMARIANEYHARSTSFDRGPNARLMTVHPMGGASIASGPEEGVVDHRGQVFGNPGLYVADASLFPKAPGWPPSMTIAALAERQADLMIRHPTRS